jgi:hypothetical protein
LVLAVLTGGPGSAAAGLLELPSETGPGRVSWHRYDLRKPATLGTVPTATVSGPLPAPSRDVLTGALQRPPVEERLLADLDPAGDRLAVRLPGSAATITLWGTTGGPLAEWTPAAGKPVEWVRFAGPGKVLALAGGRLHAFDLQTKTAAPPSAKP